MRTNRCWVLSLALALGAGSCHRDPPLRDPEPAPPATRASASSMPVVPSSDASDAGSEPEASDAGTSATTKPAFGPAPSSTPGRILCGNRQCDLAKEVCCENETDAVAQCVPKPASAEQSACEGVAGALVEKHCDEKADCSGNQSCCTTWACSGGCPPVAVCSDVPCLHGLVEQCLPGGACSSGFRCEKSQSSRTGECVYEKRGVACGKTRCSGDKPYCCWNTKTRTGECSAGCGEEPDEDRWALACTSPDDCGGYPCANMVPAPHPFTTCALGSYTVPDRSTVVFCRTLKDCPSMNLLGKPRACRADPAFPGAAKTCRYASP